MTGRMRAQELMRKHGLKGEIVDLFHSSRTGIIHGDDGYDVAFNEDSLAVGLAYSALSVGMRMSYGVFFARRAKVPTAINMQGFQTDQREAAGEVADRVTSLQVGTGVVS